MNIHSKPGARLFALSTQVDTNLLHFLKLLDDSPSLPPSTCALWIEFHNAEQGAGFLRAMGCAVNPDQWETGCGREPHASMSSTDCCGASVQAPVAKDSKRACCSTLSHCGPAESGGLALQERTVCIPPYGTNAPNPPAAKSVGG